MQPFLQKFAHILSCYGAFHLNWPCISTLAQIAIMAATSLFVHLTFIVGFFSPLPVDASAAEASLSSSELVTRLRSRLAIPGCIAPGVADRGGVSV